MSDEPITYLYCSRITIMSGEGVPFAARFVQRVGILGPAGDAAGGYEASASRDAVVVHRADCRSETQIAALLAAVKDAEHAMGCLRSKPWLNTTPLYPREPREVTVVPVAGGGA